MSQPALNPFIYPGPVPADNFIGREEALHSLLSRMATGQNTSVVGEPNANTLGGYSDPDWSGTFDFIWTGENARVFWRLLWQDDALLDPEGEDIFLNRAGNPVTKTDARFISNVTFSYNLDEVFTGGPNNTMLQLAIGNLFDREPDLIQEAIGHFSTTELLGRTYTLTVQGNW